MMRRLQIPFRAWFCLGVVAVSMFLGYFCTRFLLPLLPEYDLSLPIDVRIPFVPEWILVYVLCYAHWVVSAVVIFSGPRTRALRVAGGYALALLICAAVFLLWPGTLQRPEVEGGGLCRALTRLIYRLDEPNNLCPSVHVLNSYICWRGLWGDGHVPGWLKGFNLVALILVSLSVVLVKQHYVVDIAGGLVTGEIALQAARLFRLERPFMRLEAALCRALGRSVD